MFLVERKNTNKWQNSDIFRTWWGEDLFEHTEEDNAGTAYCDVYFLVSVELS